LELAFEDVSPQIEIAAETEAARLGGMQGYEHVCRVSGKALGRPFGGVGQRGRSWGSPDWERIGLARTLTAWLGTDRAVSIVAVRPAGASGHGAERIDAHLFDGGDGGVRR